MGTIIVYKPEKLKRVNKSHNIIEEKTIVASAKNDEQSTMKALFKNACIEQGMGNETSVICLADGADNCKSIAYSISQDCKNMTYILDWFHISMKFQNITIPDDNIELFSNIKWHLWHGNCDKALKRLAEFVKIKEIVANHSLSTKLRKLSTYIANNKAGIVNYKQRKIMDLCSLVILLNLR